MFLPYRTQVFLRKNLKVQLSLCSPCHRARVIETAPVNPVTIPKPTPVVWWLFVLLESKRGPAQLPLGTSYLSCKALLIHQLVLETSGVWPTHIAPLAKPSHCPQNF